MVEHGGVRYWEASDIAASLVARGLIPEDDRRESMRRARRWAERVGLSPAATTRTGGMLWRESDVWGAIRRHAEARVA